jgi:3-oxoacyl-[acyl-carrier protein] reductase
VAAPPLAGRCAIVTGAARGIGRATADLLAAHGARVLVSDLDGELAEEAARRIADEGGEAVFWAGDLTAPGGADAVVQAAADAFGRIDIIVNNAGYNRPGLVHRMSDDAFRAMLDIHLWVPFRIIRAAAPYLREPAKQEAERGEEVFRKIVNVSSIVGTAGGPLEVNYAAGKAGIVGMTKSLAKEWGRFKVNVNAVAFGMIETRLNSAKTPDNVISVGGEPVMLGIADEFRDAERARAPDVIPLGRWGTPVEAAGAVFFLCSPWSNYVHGQVLHVNGGLLAGMSE